MPKYRKLSHAIYCCEYHIVWVPKYRFRILSGVIKELLDEWIRQISEWKGVEIIELTICTDHIHLVASIPPKLSISDYIGILKGKTAIKIFKSFPGLKLRPYWGNHFWARGYFVSTIGIDEEKIKRYVAYQEERERQEESQSREFDLFQR
ncbi:IS200/IS605 family transposase [candidate division KSB1 bacterium]|nr:MAG: IS200/IS605 family transposase [candidate division KSB1 bacterium]